LLSFKNKENKDVQSVTSTVEILFDAASKKYKFVLLAALICVKLLLLNVTFCKELIKLKVDNKLLSNFTQLIFVSKFSSALMFARRYLNCEYKIIFNGSRIPDFKIKIKKNLITNFIYVGRINKEKGILFILKNFEELLKNKIDKFNIILCGKISNEVRIQMKYFLNKSLLKNKIKYYGFIKNKFVQKKISNADYLILPSIQIENLQTLLYQIHSVIFAYILVFDFVV
jgi:glycosyltransferase involved in cell wall biosynthesis